MLVPHARTYIARLVCITTAMHAAHHSTLTQTYTRHALTHTVAAPVISQPPSLIQLLSVERLALSRTGQQPHTMVHTYTHCLSHTHAHVHTLCAATASPQHAHSTARHSTAQLLCTALTALRSFETRHTPSTSTAFHCSPLYNTTVITPHSTAQHVSSEAPVRALPV